MTLAVVLGVVVAAWTPIIGGIIVAWNAAADWLDNRRARRTAQLELEADPEPVTDVMRNAHLLQPCAGCTPRLAVPGSLLCTMCDATGVVAAVVPDAVPVGVRLP